MEVGPDELIGGANNPVTLEFAVRKFKDSCVFSVRPIPDNSQEGVIKMVKNLETVSDVGQIASLLA
jgi:hypothetical protein